MAKRKQTIQWLKENRHYNGLKKTDITMAKRKQTIQMSVFFKPLYCLFSFSHCIVCFLLAIVLSVFF
jgi:hypothetical protein